MRARVVIFSVLIIMGLMSGGCATETQDTRVLALEVDAPLESPVWDPEEQAVFALRQDDRRLVKADVSVGGFAEEGPSRAVTLAEELEGAGENIAPDLREAGRLYVPQPELDQITIIENDDMNTLRSFDAGRAPSRVAIDQRVDLRIGAQTIFALSADGSTVTGVDLESYRTVVEEEIDLGDGVLIEASEADDEREFWVAGSEGVAYYGGSSLRRPADLSLDAGSLATDPESAGRAYVGEASAGRLLALETSPAGRLAVVNEADLEEDIEQLVAGDGRLYAATAGTLFVLDTESLEPIETIEFGRPLQEVVSGRAVPSSIAVAEEDVYLTLEGEPYMVQIEKP